MASIAVSGQISAAISDLIDAAKELGADEYVNDLGVPQSKADLERARLVLEARIRELSASDAALARAIDAVPGRG